MNEQQNFKLIDGVFSSQDSMEILTNIFSSKIQFHERKNFSSKVRFGTEDAIAIKRIPELKTNLEELIKLFVETENKGLNIKIKADITIDFIES